MHRESGTHEFRRKTVQQSVSISKTTANEPVLKPNLHHGRIGSSNFEASTPVDHQNNECEEYGETSGDSNSYRGTEEFGETRCGNIDLRIQGLPHSTVQKEDDVRRETARRLIHQFETHPNRESLMADLDKKPKNQSVQREVEGINPQHGKHGVLRDVWDHFQSTMKRLLIIFGNWHCMLYLR